MANRTLDAERLSKKTVHPNDRVDIVIHVDDPPKETKTQAEISKDRHQVLMISPFKLFSLV